MDAVNRLRKCGVRVASETRDSGEQNRELGAANERP